MTKQEILKIVKIMHDDWILANEFHFKGDIPIDVRFGFCFWLEYNFPKYDIGKVIAELTKERRYFDLDDDIFWYPSIFLPCPITEIKQIQFQPRIDHLKRTIARLEEETEQINRLV